MPRKKTSPRAAGNPLKPVCIAGLVLALFLSWALALYMLIGRKSVPERAGESAFAVELADYDGYGAPQRARDGENPEQIEKRLSALEGKARGVEERLSVLKRRRALAAIDRRYIPPYEAAAAEAAEAFPFSAPVAATAADALAYGGGRLSGEAQALLGAYAARLSPNRFENLELSVRVLAGELQDPARAVSARGLEPLLSSSFVKTALPPPLQKELLVDEFLLMAAKGDISAAAVRLNALLSASESPSGAEESLEEAGLARMGAEFFYDHGNPLRAAEIFARLAGERDLARAADALALAGELPGARNIWFALSGDAAASSAAGASGGESGASFAAEAGVPFGTEAASSFQIRRRSLYNLAASSADPREEASWLEKIFSPGLPEPSSGPARSMDSLMAYSVIRYTRLLDDSRSVAVLEEAGMRGHPLLDLELLRRSLDGFPPTRAAAEVWLLLGRQSGEEAVYEWAAWYFDRQKLYGETERLLAEARRKGMAGPWLGLHGGLALLRAGNVSEGEKALNEAGTGAADWRVAANLGRIQESRRAVAAALEHYQSAAALVREKSSAALVQVRLSRCLEALGRTRESRRALEYALELDPDNLNIRRELRRFDSR